MNIATHFMRARSK